MEKGILFFYPTSCKEVQNVWLKIAKESNAWLTAFCLVIFAFILRR